MVACRKRLVGGGFETLAGEAAVPRSKRAAPTAVTAFREREEIMIG